MKGRLELPIQCFRLLLHVVMSVSLLLMLSSLRISLAHARGPEIFQWFLKQRGFLNVCEATLTALANAVVSIYYSTSNAVTWLLSVLLTSCEKVLMELLAIKHLRVLSVFRRLIPSEIVKQMINSLKETREIDHVTVEGNNIVPHFRKLFRREKSDKKNGLGHVYWMKPVRLFLPRCVKGEGINSYRLKKDKM